MAIRLSVFPPAARALPALAAAVALAVITGASVTGWALVARDPQAFTGRFEGGLPVFRIEPVAVSAPHAASVGEIAARDDAKAPGSAGECRGPAT